ncbi:ABC transporter substrate-binding protein [Oscillospiraceae bacterium OttesenSCG-928-F05]|nr:ABC transporter substrate-binding protein [Oscillospiraceae bacterium OttesenSCG-928-F05]
MMKKKALAFALALMMALTLFGCTNGENPTQAPVDSDSPAASTSPDTPNTPEPQEDPKTIAVVGFSTSASLTDLSDVVEEINNILTPATNTILELDVGSTFANYMEQMNLRFAAQEKLDWVLSGVHFNYSDNVTKGYFNPLNNLLAEYGHNIKEVIGEDFLGAARYTDGEIYGITQRRDLAAGWGVVYRKDLLDKYDLSVDDVTVAEDMEPIFEMVSQNEDDLAMIHVVTNTGIARHLTPLADMDPLGATDDVALLSPFDSTDIVFVPETPEYMQAVTKAREWFENHYMFSSIGTDTTTSADYMKNDRLFSFFNTYHANTYNQYKNTLGFDETQLGVVKTSTMMATTSTVNVFLWCNPVFSADPEAAMRFMDFFYGSEEMINLLVWGIEGRHYVKRDDGYIEYPEGITRDTVGFNLNCAYLWADNFKNYIMAGDDKTVWERMEVDNRNSKLSNGLGFTFDVTNVKSEYALITSVWGEYATAISNGTVDPESTVPDYIDKMKAAGVDKVVAEKQRQFDLWLASQQ